MQTTKAMLGYVLVWHVRRTGTDYYATHLAKTPRHRRSGWSPDVGDATCYPNERTAELERSKHRYPQTIKVIALDLSEEETP